MTKAEKDKLWSLIEDPIEEWCNQDDAELWDNNQTDLVEIHALFEKIPTED
jgi:hypothetical protein